MDLELQNDTREFSFNDANELLSIVCNKEDLLEKKRRYLQLPAYIRCGKRLVPRKRYKFMDEKLIPESVVRNDEVSCDIVRSTVEESFRFFDNYQSENHAVANSLDLFDNVNVTESTERILSVTGELTNATLYSIACITTRNNLKFKGTRHKLIEIVKDHLTNYLLDASEDQLHQMSKLFKNPKSYLQNNQHIVTPVTKDLLVSISKTLERLDELKVRELDAIFRRLSGVKVKPHFAPVVNNHLSTEVVLSRVRNLFNTYLSGLQEGQEMPKEFANGLTVVVLAIYSRLDHSDIPISEFRHLPEDVMCTQMAILDALRSLHKIKSKEEIDPLISLIDPNGMVPRSSFRSHLKKFLIEYLFVCDEISVPNEVLRAVDLINKREQGKSNLFSKENRDKEVEAVLDVSCYLKSIAMNALEEVSEESTYAEDVDDEGYDGGLNKPYSDNNDFEFCGTDFFFSSVGEGFGKDLEAASSNCMESVNSAQGSSFSTASCTKRKKLSEKQNGRFQAGSSKAGSEIEINEICDEAALVAHKLIGHVIDGFLKLEKREADRSVASYLTDGAPSANKHRDGKGNSNVDEESAIILDVVEKILPSFPKSSLHKVKNILGL